MKLTFSQLFDSRYRYLFLVDGGDGSEEKQITEKSLYLRWEAKCSVENINENT